MRLGLSELVECHNLAEDQDSKHEADIAVELANVPRGTFTFLNGLRA